MSGVLVPTRRGLLTGLLALGIAPAIVRAESLMPVRSLAPVKFWVEEPIRANSLLTINMITREAVRLWKESNNIMLEIDAQYATSFCRSLRIYTP